VPLASDKNASRARFSCSAGEVAEVELADDKVALAFFRKAVEIDPTHAAALSSLGRLHYKAGRWEDLLETYRCRAPARPRARQRRLLSRWARFSRSASAGTTRPSPRFARAVDADPDAPPGAARARTKAPAEGQVGRARSACSSSSSAGRKAPTSVARAAFRIGEVYENRCVQPDKALARSKQSLAADVGVSSGARRARAPAHARARLEKRLADELDKEAKVARDPPLAVAALLRAGELYRDELADPRAGHREFRGACSSADPAHVEALLALEPLYRRKGAHGTRSLNTYAAEARVLSGSGSAHRRVARARAASRSAEPATSSNR
jgi:tetratricopeptide (TPR) repeat protein